MRVYRCIVGMYKPYGVHLKSIASAGAFICDRVHESARLRPTALNPRVVRSSPTCIFLAIPNHNPVTRSH